MRKTGKSPLMFWDWQSILTFVADAWVAPPWTVLLEDVGMSLGGRDLSSG